MQVFIIILILITHALALRIIYRIGYESGRNAALTNITRQLGSISKASDRLEVEQMGTEY